MTLAHTQTPAWHVVPAAHVPVWQVPPQPSPAPHAAPVHSGWQTQTPFWQVSCGPGHGPEHLPPQPSSTPHALPEQSGTHAHWPELHVSGELQALPAQHGCPLPPHAPQLDEPHVVPPEHVTHTVPPAPHAPLLVPGSHVAPEQHPWHDVGSHAHAPFSQRWPAAQLPV